MKKLIHSLMLVVLLLQSFLPAIDVFAREAGGNLFARPEMAEPQETVPPAVAEDQELPTATLIAEITATPPETVPASETPAMSATPSETPLPATATATVTPEPTQVEESERAADLPYEIILKSDPEFITPGGRFNLHWQITAKSLEGLDLVFLLPYGVTLLEEKKQSLDAEKPSSTYRIPAEEKGVLHFEISPDAEMPVLVEALLVPQALEESLAVSAALEPVGQSWVALVEKAEISKSGGKVQGLNGKVVVDFPAGVFSDKAEVFIHRPLRESMPSHSLSGQPFEVTARNAMSKQEQRKFKEFVEIEVSYEEIAVPEELEDDLYLHWYDPKTDTWQALTTSVDRERKILRGRTNHFTVFDIGVNNWQASRLPTIDSFQVSSFTGAASYSFPINVPPGPGNLRPDLVLNYNSQVIDQSTVQTQASWVGMGWSLDVGSITWDSRENVAYRADDTYMLNINGVSSRIISDGTNYRLADENFWRLSYDQTTSTWTVFDKVGNKYFFEPKLYLYTENTDCNEFIVGYHKYPYDFRLTKIQNIYGQEIQYSYETETKNLEFPAWRGYSDKCDSWRYYPVETAVYLKTITYANGLNRIRFERQARLDFPQEWVTDGAYHSFERQRLQDIIVETDSNKDGVYELIRRYGLSYAAQGASVWPEYIWSSGGATSTLASITEYGQNNTSSLPSTTFTYGDKMHLTIAMNGYGGTVEFKYDAWVYEANAPRFHTWRNLFSGQEWNWGKRDNDGNFQGFLRLEPPARIELRGTAYGRKLLELMRPGGKYKLSVKNFFVFGNPLRMSLGVNHAENVYDYAKDQFVIITPDNPKAIIELPMTAKSLYPLMRADQGNQHDEQYVRVSDYKLQLLPVYYRVIEKKLSDGNGHTYSFTYSYNSPVLNDDVTSPNSVCPDGATDCKEYIPKYSEFRGHKTVTETGPDGRVIVTEFFQDDNLKGQVKSILVQQGGGKVSEIIKNYSISDLPMQPLVHQQPCCNGTVYRGVKHVWTYQTSQENRIYASDGSYSATREVYTYEPTYGNQTFVTRQSWDGAVWQDYIKTETNYFPNISGVYLVGLPGRIRQLDSAGKVLASTLYFYDNNIVDYTLPASQGKLTSVRTRIGEETWNQVSYDHDTWGNRISETTWSGYGSYTANPTTGERTTTTVYDPIYHTYPISVTNPLNQTVSWVYNYKKGVPVSETDPNGAVTTATYDDFGRLLTLVRPGDDSTNPTILVSYSNGAPFETIIRQRLDGNRYFGIRRVYDGMGRQVLQQSGSGRSSGVLTVFNTVDTQYVSVNETKQSAPYASGETPAYTTTLQNPAARSTTVTAPDGSQTVTVVNGLNTTVTDPAGRVTTSQADVWGRTISVTPPDGPGLTYTYDLLGRLLTTTRGGSTTTLTYDMAGRKIAMSDPDMGNWSYTYDALGNLISQTDARGCSLTLSYDLLNRLTAKNSSGTGCGTQVNTTYTYDFGANGKGRRTAMQDASTGSGSTTWAYDARGRMALENKLINGQVYRTRWSYNSADLPVSMIYPDGEEVKNYYTPQMLLDYVDGDSTYVYKTAYDAAGRITERKLGGELIPVDPPAPTAPIFSDVAADHWAREIIEGLYTLGIVGHCATSPLRFCPDSQDVTRASIAVDILRAKYGGSYIPPAPANQRFTDVPATHPAYAWIDKFAADGITTGCASGTFCPDSQVLRIQVIIFLLRAKYGGGYVPPAVPEGGHIFADMIGNSAEAWAVDAYNKGITNGCGNGNFCPNDPVYRAMAAVLIEQAFKRIPSPLPEEIQAPVIEQTYNYYSWNQQGGRLQELVTTTSGYQTPVQSLLYQYDSVGNISAINNTVNNENQGFGYDSLDRLTSWTLNNTLQERYTYSPNGNLLSKGAPALSQFRRCYELLQEMSDSCDKLG